MTSDEELMLEFQRGSREAFEELNESVPAYFDCCNPRLSLDDFARADFSLRPDCGLPLHADLLAIRD